MRQGQGTASGADLAQPGTTGDDPIGAAFGRTNDDMADLATAPGRPDQRPPVDEHFVADPGPDGDDAEIMGAEAGIGIAGTGQVVEDEEPGARPELCSVGVDRNRPVERTQDGG